jgi:hypothetical protein
VHVEALRLFGSLVAWLPHHNPAVQHVLLASRPSSSAAAAAEPTHALYLLLLRGLTCAVTAPASLQALLQVHRARRRTESKRERERKRGAAVQQLIVSPITAGLGLGTPSRAC